MPTTLAVFLLVKKERKLDASSSALVLGKAILSFKFMLFKIIKSDSHVLV